MTVKIIVDKRELNSGVIRALEKYPDCDIQFMTLEIGDYILSEHAAVERKTGEDALSSLIGEEKGKIFRQLHDLVGAYQKPLLLLECDLNDLFVRNIHPGAIWGMLRSFLWNGCPIEFTYNAEGTAKKLYELAKAEQNGCSKDFQPHGMKTKRSEPEQLVYSLSSLPGVGSTTALNLLKHFKTLNAIMNADEKALSDVDNVGKKTATAIHEFFRREYKSHDTPL